MSRFLLLLSAAILLVSLLYGEVVWLEHRAGALRLRTLVEQIRQDGRK